MERRADVVTDRRKKQSDEETIGEMEMEGRTDGETDSRQDGTEGETDKRQDGPDVGTQTP